MNKLICELVITLTLDQIKLGSVQLSILADHISQRMDTSQDGVFRTNLIGNFIECVILSSSMLLPKQGLVHHIVINLKAIPRVIELNPCLTTCPRLHD